MIQGGYLLFLCSW